MLISRTRLDRFLSAALKIKRGDVRLMLARSRVLVDGCVAKDIRQIVDRFSLVSVDGQVLQQRAARYIMLHKPQGVVSATTDDKHKTVIDLIPGESNGDLHLVGRLDFNTTGLVLLTNDGQWSRALTLPETKVPKRYHVTLAKPLTSAYVGAFAEGMYFPFEGITTRPALLRVLSDYEAEVTLEEGRYHQIKRMFSRMDNRVVALHRQALGNLELDEALLPGYSRDLTLEELERISG